jgi:hypothetical protein
VSDYPVQLDSCRRTLFVFLFRVALVLITIAHSRLEIDEPTDIPCTFHIVCAGYILACIRFEYQFLVLFLFFNFSFCFILCTRRRDDLLKEGTTEREKACESGACLDDGDADVAKSGIPD